MIRIPFLNLTLLYCRIMVPIIFVLYALFSQPTIFTIPAVVTDCRFLLVVVVFRLPESLIVFHIRIFMKLLNVVFELTPLWSRFHLAFDCLHFALKPTLLLIFSSLRKGNWFTLLVWFKLLQVILFHASRYFCFNIHIIIFTAGRNRVFFNILFFFILMLLYFNILIFGVECGLNFVFIF